MPNYLLAREPINLPRGQLASVRYAPPIASNFRGAAK